ncbi:MAG TPA: hypothetical protein VFA38_07900, partial [Nitrospirales bacterium]|nr:hypothetical protein [Nitrospirales bacterium]
MTHTPTASRRRWPLAALLILSLPACSYVSSQFTRATLPDLGPPLPMTVRMEIDPSVTEAHAQYVNACNRFDDLRIGRPLEDILIDAAHQTFKGVQYGRATGTEGKPDVTVKVRLLQPVLKLQNDNLYDRVPAELTLDAFAEFFNADGKLIAEQPIHIVRKERWLVAADQRRCDYMTDKFSEDAAVAFATKFAQESRGLLGANTAPTVGAAPSTLALKASAIDTNGNGVWEPGERVRIRVEVANGGPAPVAGGTLKLTVPPALVTPFGNTMLAIGLLNPGEARTMEFGATIPAGLPDQQAAFTVSVTEASGAVAQQTVAARLGAAPRAMPTDDIDAVPASNGIQRPQVFLVSVGITAHRDPQMAVRKFAAADAELMTAYLEALGGVPPSNVRMLQDKKALRPDIEEAILDWLPAHLAPESLVIVYFSGQAKVAPSGEVFLVPFEGGSSTARLYPLKDLQAALDRLKARHVVLIFDGPVSKLGDGKGRVKDPQWDAGGAGGHVIRLIGAGTGASVESEKLRHGLFTYHLVRGLRGEADENLNGEVTLGELAAYLSLPSVANRSAGVVLTKTAAPLSTSA